MMAETSEIIAPSYENALDWGYEEEEDLAPPSDLPHQRKDVWQQEDANGEALVAAAKPVAVMEDLGRGLMFVRVPKSDVQDRSVEIAQQEFEIQLTTCRLLNENRRLKKVRNFEERCMQLSMVIVRLLVANWVDGRSLKCCDDGKLYQIWTVSVL